jgi:hypothetical protein
MMEQMRRITGMAAARESAIGVKNRLILLLDEPLS